MSDAEAHEIIRTIRQEIEHAVDVILTASEGSLKDLEAAREGIPAPLEVLESRLYRVLEACAFQDITGQRLSKLGTLLSGTARADQDENSLLNGPALAGQGLDQDAADLLVQFSSLKN
tara:strand:- start:1110 stop:1463 length:354 start_codon:yes stop_codon:yes gene_type:complete